MKRNIRSIDVKVLYRYENRGSHIYFDKYKVVGITACGYWISKREDFFGSTGSIETVKR